MMLAAKREEEFAKEDSGLERAFVIPPYQPAEQGLSTESDQGHDGDDSTDQAQSIRRDRRMSQDDTDEWNKPKSKSGSTISKSRRGSTVGINNSQVELHTTEAAKIITRVRSRSN